jgi:radical SAM superfamily enzyme YgiQ (UPF0313 family)
MKVLLTHGYFLRDDDTEREVMMPYPPQGLLHIAAWLKEHGIPSEVFDTTFETREAWISRIKAETPDILGIYVNLMTRVNIVAMIRQIRDEPELKDVRIILGGPDTRHHAEKYLKTGADFCVIGEGEETTRQLIVCLQNGGTGLKGIKGLSFFNEDRETVFTGDPPLIEPLDKLPFPDFRLVPVDEYFTVWKMFHGYTSLTLSTMRGCPFSCQWCSKAVFGRTCRRRDARKVVEEIIKLEMLFAPDRYWFVDDVFTMHESWLSEFHDQLNLNNLTIRYECITRADRMNDNIVRLLKDSGCYRIWIGAESGSQQLLDKMDRKVKVEKVQEMIRKASESGMEAGTFLMLGYPGEEEKDILETVRHLKAADPDLYTITLAYPIPGTGFYKEVRGTLVEPGNWGSYSDRDLSYEKTYSDRYYRHAIRYVHHELNAFRHLNGKRYFQWAKHKFVAKLARTMMRYTK